MLGGVGRVGAVGGVRRRAPSGEPDFFLSNSTVVTGWVRVDVGQLIPIGYTADEVEFELLEGSGASGDEAGYALVNG